MPQPELAEAQSAEKAQGHAESFSSDACVIRSPEHYRSRRWSWHDLAEGDTRSIQYQYDLLCQVAEALPETMKIVLHGADVFTFLWQLIGFNNLCFAIYEDPDFISEVVGSLAEAQYHAYQGAIDRIGDKIGTVFYSDDIAHGNGPFMSPDFYRQHLFPAMRRYAELAETIGAPFIYHSDGKLYPVLDDLIGLGVRGIQPLEPKAMDPMEIKRRWPGRLCLMGHIDLDLMARGTPEQVRAHVRETIDRLNIGGGYMPGVSNTVPHYVRLDNYLTMIETIREYPLEPMEVISAGSDFAGGGPGKTAVNL